MLQNRLSSLRRLRGLTVDGLRVQWNLLVGFQYHYLVGVMDIHRIVEHLGLGTFSLLGHSMGAGLSSVYAAMFPEKVKVYIYHADLHASF